MISTARRSRTVTDYKSIAALVHEDGIPDIPEHIIKDIEDSFEKYLFFETVSRGKRKYTCTACHEAFFEGDKVVHQTMKPEDYALRHAKHRDEARCPLCGTLGTVINVKVSDVLNFCCDKWLIVFFALSYDKVIFRCLNPYRYYNTRRSYRLKDISGHTEMIERGRYILSPGNAVCLKSRYYHDKLEQTRIFEGPFSWNHGYYQEVYSYSIVNAGELGIYDTFLKYNGFKYQSCGGSALFLKYLCHYAVFPQLEMLGKLGHHDVVRDIVIGNRELKSYIDRGAKTPWDMFGITHSEYNAWREKYHLDFEVLKIFKRIHGKGERDLFLADRYLTMCHSTSESFSAIALARKLKLDLRELYKYIYKVHASSPGCHHCPGITLSSAYDLWKDYMDMAKKLGILKTVSPYPRDLKGEHDKLLFASQREKQLKKEKDRIAQIKNFKLEADREAAALEKKFKKVNKIYGSIREKYSYENDKYVIVIPEGIADIIVEGKTLCHCIATVDRYYERIERNESYLFFLRLKDAPDIPYYTLEVEPGGTVRQKRTFYDRQNPDIDDAVKFLHEWQNAIQSRLSDTDRRKAAMSKKLRNENFTELRKNKVEVRNGFLRGQLLADVLEADLLEVGAIVENKGKKNKIKAG